MEKGGGFKPYLGWKKYTTYSFIVWQECRYPPPKLLLWKIRRKRTSRLPIPQVEYQKKQILVIFVANLNWRRFGFNESIRLAVWPATTFQGPQCGVRFGNPAKHGEQCGYFLEGCLSHLLSFGGSCKGDDFLSYYTISFHIYLLGKKLLY